MVAWFAGGLALAWIGWLGARRAGARWWNENRRGRTIPATLGWAVAIAVAGIVLVVVRQIDTDGVRDSQAGELLGAGIVFLAGVVDDGLVIDHLTLSAEPLPPYDLGYLDFWWYDAEKAEALRAAGAFQ